jgi:hypothetical protein
MDQDQAMQNAGQQLGHEAAQADSNAQNTPQTQPQNAQQAQQPSPADSNATPEAKTRTQDAASTPAAATTPASTIQTGNVHQPTIAAPAGQSPPVKEWPRITLARGANGKLYNPAKGEPAPKAQSAALLKPVPVTTYDEAIPRERGIKGLSDIPKDWPKLPGSVSLSSEIGWVQANRLDVVKELPSGGVKVDLTKAYVPAPSKSALSWLETAIRNPSKFAELAAKQASNGQDEQEFIRRERMAIGEIRSILSEMMVDKGA